jgi:hypothetical protein
MPEMRDGEELADDGIEPDLHSQLAQVVDLGIDDDVGQAELRNAVLEHATCDVQSFEDGDRHAVLGQIAGAGQARRTRSDDGGALTGAAGSFHRLIPTAPYGGVRDEALQAADGHRRILVADHAGRLALGFLRADAAAYGGQGVGALSGCGRIRGYRGAPGRR